MVCWVCKERPDPRPCLERLPRPRRPTEPAVGETGRTAPELSAQPSARVAAASEDKSGAPAHQLTTKFSRDAALWATG